MTHTDSRVQNAFNQYLRISLWIIAALALLVLAMMSISYKATLISALIVTVVFSLISSVTYGLVWKQTALTSPKALTKFFLAASAVRMAAAIIVMGVWCYLVRDVGAIKAFVLLFFAFYLILLVFDCVFFTRQEKSNKNPKQ